MYLTQIPFFTANRSVYDFEAMGANPEQVFQLYPELFRCVACNACTKVCPMDVEVMDYVAAIKQGDMKKATELSFDCIQCGLCASRCMAEMSQYHIAQLARRIHGSKNTPPAEHLSTMVEDIEQGKYKECLAEAMKADEETLKRIYQEREMEPHMGPEDWTPEDGANL